MIKQLIRTKMFPALLAFSLLTSSFGGAFAASASAASPEPSAAEASVREDSSKTGLIAAVAAVGLIAALSHGGGGDSTAAPSKGTGSSGSTPPSGSTAGGASASEEQQALALLNKDRAANGLPALAVNSQLTQLARNYARDMINRGFFSHNNPEGLTPFDRMRQAGISYKYAGENLAVNSSVSGAEAAFMSSSGHRANILNANFTEVGIGVVRSSTGSLYVVQEFIGR